MTGLVAALRAVNIVLGAILAGGMVMELMLILPQLRALPPPEALRAHGLFSPVAWRYLPVCGVTFTLTAIGVLALADDLTTVARAILALGLAFTAAAITTNLGFYLQTDRRLRTGGRVPDDYHGILRRLTGLHILRLMLFGSAFCCFVVAAVVV